VNNEFWRGKRVLVTGHTGFKGGWLCLWLKHLGAQVVGYSLAPPSSPSFFETAGVVDGMVSISGDIQNLSAVREVMDRHVPEIVFHLAAQSLVRRSYASPVETFATNVLGTAHVLEAARQTSSVRAVVNVTSDKCYENQEWIWGYRENDPMGGHDPYSSSKGCAELVTAAYRKSFCNGERGLALASARAGNVIGGGDWAEDRLVPDVLRAIERTATVLIRQPGAVRPWQHVLEPLWGYLLLAQKLVEDGAQYAEGWNFGPSEADTKPVGWIADYLTRAWGDGAVWQSGAQDYRHEAGLLKLDCSKARARLGWSPRWSIEEALDAVVSWHRAFLRGENMHEVTHAQIEQYMLTH